MRIKNILKKKLKYKTLLLRVERKNYIINEIHFRFLSSEYKNSPFNCLRTRILFGNSFSSFFVELSFYVCGADAIAVLAVIITFWFLGVGG